MKKILFLFLLLPFLIYGQSQPVDTVSFKDLEYKDYHGTALPERGSLRYKSDEDSPYTGMIVDKYGNGQKRGEANMIYGRIVGVAIEWNEKGQKQKESKFVNGLVVSTTGYSWHENGQQEREIHMAKEDGAERLVSMTEWYEEGQKKHELIMEKGKEEGLLTAWYKNGQKAREGINGEGLQTKWNDEGQKISESTFVSGWEVGIRTIWYETGQKKSESTYVRGNRQPITVKNWDKDGNEIKK
jgi:antitoxin component YwqK of YwqJK toxin-antitoxin module